MLRTNEPSSFRTCFSSAPTGRNHSTYLSGWTPPYVSLRLSAYGGDVMIKSTQASGSVGNTSRQSPWWKVLIIFVSSVFIQSHLDEGLATVWNLVQSDQPKQAR